MVENPDGSRRIDEVDVVAITHPDVQFFAEFTREALALFVSVCPAIFSDSSSMGQATVHCCTFREIKDTSVVLFGHTLREGGGYCQRTLPLTSNLLLGVDNGVSPDKVAPCAGIVSGTADLGAYH